MKRTQSTSDQVLNELVIIRNASSVVASIVVVVIAVVVIIVVVIVIIVVIVLQNVNKNLEKYKQTFGKM